MDSSYQQTVSLHNINMHTTSRDRIRGGKDKRFYIGKIMNDDNLSKMLDDILKDIDIGDNKKEDVQETEGCGLIVDTARTYPLLEGTTNIDSDDISSPLIRSVQVTGGSSPDMKPKRATKLPDNVLSQTSFGEVGKDIKKFLKSIKL